ncbi:MAG TPA: LssY C-terminal domain-containing protein [bacterium]|nr:LssY C-terminal domain-containing protein [bacterium]
MKKRLIPWTFLLLLTLLGGSACVKFKPDPSSSAEFHQRLKTQTQDKLEVSAAVLGKKESRKYFGINLEKKHVQALYLKIVNRGTKPYWLMPISIDQNYYSPNEVAYRHRTGHSGEVQIQMNEFFAQQQIESNIGPGETKEGFIYTNVDFGSKEFGVDLLGRGELKRFNFVIPIPGLSADYQEVDFAALYKPEEIREVSLSELRAALEAYPCCTSEKGKEVYDGDAVNLVVVGDLDDILSAFVRQGWRETAVQDKHSSMKMVKSLLFRSPYQNAPMSKLYLFGRSQDVAFQKPRRTINQRNHFRLWMTPLRFGGKTVWIGTISRDIGLRFTAKAFMFVTHKIDSDIDEARDFLIQDLVISDSVDKVGLVKGVGEFSIEEPHKNLMGDSWYTDGFRGVIFIGDQPTPLLKTRALQWEQPRNLGLTHLDPVKEDSPK